MTWIYFVIMLHSFLKMTIKTFSAHDTLVGWSNLGLKLPVVILQDGHPGLQPGTLLAQRLLLRALQAHLGGCHYSTDCYRTYLKDNLKTISQRLSLLNQLLQDIFESTAQDNLTVLSPRVAPAKRARCSFSNREFSSLETNGQNNLIFCFLFMVIAWWPDDGIMSKCYGFQNWLVDRMNKRVLFFHCIG